MLEYFKLFVSWPFASIFITVFTILIFRKPISEWIRFLIIKGEYKGGIVTASSQFSTSLTKFIKDNEADNIQIEQSDPRNKTTVVEKEEATKQLLLWRTNAYIWEYRYLNYYLVYNTQRVLDWFYDLKEPILYSNFDALNINLISDPKERHAIISALLQHYLIEDKNNLLKITEKGREYVGFRGRMPQANP
jgi:hypothetical protein